MSTPSTYRRGQFLETAYGLVVIVAILDNGSYLVETADGKRHEIQL